MITVTGYNDLIKEIEEMCVDMPRNGTVDQIQMFLNGWKECQESIIQIIEEIREGFNQHG